MDAPEATRRDRFAEASLGSRWYPRFVESVALAALVHAQPDGFNEASWLGQMLAQRWTRYVPAGDGGTGSLRAWVVGGVQDNETLVQARPVVRDPRADFLADLLRAPTQTTLAAYAVVSGSPARPGGSDSSTALPPTSSGLPPTSSSSSSGLPPTSSGLPPTSSGLPPTSSGLPPTSSGMPPSLAMVRFQRWIGVRAESSLLPAGRADEVEALRAGLRSTLPEFLIRSGGPIGDRELVVLSFLATLHAAGELGKAYATPATIRKALAALDERLGHPAHLNLMVSDGRSVGVIHRGGRLVSLTPPPPPRPARAISQPHQRPTASLLLFDPHAAPASDSGDPDVPEGVFTVHVRQPGVHDRD